MMARGIGNRQKKIVTPRKAFPLSPRERDGVRAPEKPKHKLKFGRQPRPHPNPLPGGEGT
jgi:hypothetical protein